MRNGFIAVVWLLLIGLGIFAWLSTQDYDLSKALRFAGMEEVAEPVAEADKTKTAQPAKAPEATAVSPTFDIVRVEPDGTAVLAGRSAAGADVTVLVDGSAVGEAKADERGEWAVAVDKPLASGNHSLTISSVAGSETRTSEQSVAIAVPERKDEKPLIVLSQKGEPSKVIQAPESVTTVQTAPPATEQAAAETAPAPQPAPAEPAAKPASGAAQQQVAAAPAAETPQSTAPAQPEAPADDAKAPEQPTQTPAEPAQTPAPAAQEPVGMAKAPAATTPESQLALRTVDYDDKGNMVFQGQVAPGGTVRLYVDNKPIADATADGTGTWTLRVLQHIEPGNHDLRVDQITDNAQVAARIELPFTRARPEDVIAALNQPAAASAPAAPGSPASSEIVKTEPAAAPGSDATRSNVVASAPQAETTPSATQAAPEAPAAPAATAPAEAAPTAPAPSSGGASTVTQTQPAPSSGTEQMAAVQQPSAAPAPATSAPAPAASAPAPAASAPAPAASAAAPAASAPAPAASAAAPAPSATAPTPAAPAATSSSAGTQPPAPPAPPAATLAPTPAPAPAVAAAPAEPAPQSSAAAPAASVAPAPSSTAQAPSTPAPAPAQSAPAETVPAQAAAEAPASAAEPAAAQQMAAAPAASASKTTTAPDGTTVLQRTGRIIIQPGNNLWNISRVIYGQGLSYTTIYQANKDQIRNPNLIYPGQIFQTPGATPPEEIAPDDRTPMPGAQDNG